MRISNIKNQKVDLKLQTIINNIEKVIKTKAKPRNVPKLKVGNMAIYITYIPASDAWYIGSVHYSDSEKLETYIGSGDIFNTLSESERNDCTRFDVWNQYNDDPNYFKYNRNTLYLYESAAIEHFSEKITLMNITDSKYQDFVEREIDMSFAIHDLEDELISQQRKYENLTAEILELRKKTNIVGEK